MVKNERQEASNNIHIHCLILIKLQGLFVVRCRAHIDVTIRSQSYSATNWQQEVCHFQDALNSASYF